MAQRTFNVTPDKIKTYNDFKKRCIDLKISASKRIMHLIEQDLKK